MKPYSVGLGIIVALAVACITAGVAWNASSKIPHGFYEWGSHANSPFVQIAIGSAIGSGVHIGDGFILTAAHVVGAAKETKVFADTKELMRGEVLWSNTKYDIALVRVARAKMAAAQLSCEPNFIGQNIRAYGNPMGVEFVYTSSTVVGAPRKHGPWDTVVPVDGTVVYGQSGGGVVDDQGRVVGITVGVMPTPYGIAAFGFIVPATIACQLLGRTA